MDKIVPKNYEQLLNPILLAVWFMDDGGKSQSTPKAAYINATSFSPEERVQIKKAFLNVFELEINIQTLCICCFLHLLCLQASTYTLRVCFMKSKISKEQAKQKIARIVDCSTLTP